MNDKINPELELAIETRSESTDDSLYLGYDKESDTWNLIIRYTGDIDDIRERLMNRCVYLLGGFAVINIAAENIAELQMQPRILYIDKSGFYSYGQYDAYDTAYDRYSSCITESFRRKYGLTGEGVYIGIVDSGIDISCEEFYGEDGIRIAGYWDQNASYSEAHANRYNLGRIYDRQELEAVISSESEGRRAIAADTHGTEMASVAAGRYVGVAPGADIIAVAMADSPQLPDTAGIMMSIFFASSD